MSKKQLIKQVKSSECKKKYLMCRLEAKDGSQGPWFSGPVR